jgi:hypothetical protein
MASFDAYASCPCGSGKKFKWCCQPVHVQITKAFEQDAEGQHEAALRAMDQVVAEHPGNPEAWGRKAQLLYQNDKVEEAEQALDKAFALSPTYPFGHLLRGKFRHFEGELPGALTLFRKAAELYDPEAKPLLAQVHALIADCEMKLNHPVAARAALDIAQRSNPSDATVRQGVDQIFGEGSRFPQSARKAYSLKEAPAGAPAEKRTAWEKARQAAALGKLADAANAFAQLAAQHESDVALWYNLGLTRAWLGDQGRALEALDRYVQLETNEDEAAAAWALAEVLRCGQGMEDQADYVEYSVTIPIGDPQQFGGFLSDLERDRRLVGGVVNEEEGTLSAMILEKLPALTAELAARQNSRLGAYLLLLGNIVRVWNINRDALDAVYEEMRQKASKAFAGEPYQARGPAHFTDVFSEALVFPMGAADENEAKRRIGESLERWFEETWIRRPLNSLNHIPPLDAAGHGTLRKKLRGVIQFLDECGKVAQLLYDFDRLRRKLGLLERAAAAPTVSAAAAAQDISALGVAELAGLSLETLSEEQLEQAFQTAKQVDAGELAGRFAEALAARPPRAERADRWAYFAHLVNAALSAGDTQAALNWIDEGEKHDCEHNEGKRRNDYELRRGQVLAKSGDAAGAQEVFDRLVARLPEMKFIGSAAEAMLSAKQGSRALQFAERGLAEARKQNNRDSEQYFKELVEAAKRQGS